MPFFFLGLILVLSGGFFLRSALKSDDKEGVVGTIAVLIAGIILMLVFGLFYRDVTLFWG